RAAEGSARDGLSILDQAIAHGAGTVTASQVRDMLGLADRGRIRRLLQLVLSGEATAALAELDEAHELGIDPMQLLRGIMEALHSATRAKAGATSGALQSAEERENAEQMAGALSWGTIHRLEEGGRHQLTVQLHDQVGLVSYAPPELVLKPTRPLGGDWPRALAAALKSLTGTSWQVALSDEAGEPSLLDQEKMAEERVRADVLADPNVRAVMDAFPGAELESFTMRGS